MDESRLLAQVITAVRAGQTIEARRQLQKELARDPSNEKCWLFLSTLVERDDQQIACLQHVLEINPENQIAHKKLDRIKVKAAIPPSTAQPVVKDQNDPASQPPLVASASCCSSCGVQIGPGTRFCSNCGKNLVETTPPPSSSPSQPRQSPIPTAPIGADRSAILTKNEIQRLYYRAHVIIDPLIVLGLLFVASGGNIELGNLGSVIGVMVVGWVILGVLVDDLLRMFVIPLLARIFSTVMIWGCLGEFFAYVAVALVATFMLVIIWWVALIRLWVIAVIKLRSLSGSD